MSATDTPRKQHGSGGEHLAARRQALCVPVGSGASPCPLGPSHSAPEQRRQMRASTAGLAGPRRVAATRGRCRLGWAPAAVGQAMAASSNGSLQGFQGGRATGSPLFTRHAFHSKQGHSTKRGKRSKQPQLAGRCTDLSPSRCLPDTAGSGSAAHHYGGSARSNSVQQAPLTGLNRSSASFRCLLCSTRESRRRAR